MITTYTLIASASGRVLCQRDVPATDPGAAVQWFWARLTAEQRAACTCIECTTLPPLLKEPS